MKGWMELNFEVGAAYYLNLSLCSPSPFKVKERTRNPNNGVDSRGSRAVSICS